MTEIELLVEGSRMTTLRGRALREHVVRVVARYKPEGVVEVQDEHGRRSCDVDDEIRETAHEAGDRRRLDVEIVGSGPRQSPPAMLSIERTEHGLRLSGHGQLSGEAELRGFATLLARRIDVEPVDGADDDFRSELLVARGRVEDRALVGAHHAVLRHAVAAPERVAVEDGDVKLSYGQLAALVVYNARLLASVVDNGVPVAVALERGWRSLVAQVATFLAGSPVVLIDPSLPQARLTALLESSDVTAAFVGDGDAVTAGVATAAGITVMSVQATVVGGAINLDAELASAPDFDEDAVSHIAFTSGSSGTPKAVQLRHVPMANTAVAIANATGLSTTSRASWFCPPGVGLVEVDLFPTLSVGATVVVAPDALGADPRAAWAWLGEHRISHTQLPTAFAEQLIKLSDLAPDCVRSMRVAGERLSVWPSPTARFRVLNVYGSTEANVVAVCDVSKLARLGPRDREGTVPIGRPVQNVNVYILDEALRPVPRGVIGELCITGRSLSRGYLNRSDEHRRRFLPNLIEDDPYPVLYRSGDLARFGPAGHIEVVGRVDDEIKINGTRIHPAEVEHDLLALGGVSAAAVVAHEPAGGGRILVAYLTADDSAPTVEGLKVGLGARLPPAAVPTHFVFRELPMNRNGKIDRELLRRLPIERPSLSSEFVAPASEREQVLCRLFAEVLGVGTVGAEDDFFELGGGSLHASRLIERARTEARIDLDFVMVFDHPTPRSLTNAV